MGSVNQSKVLLTAPIVNSRSLAMCWIILMCSVEIWKNLLKTSKLCCIFLLSKVYAKVYEKSLYSALYYRQCFTGYKNEFSSVEPSNLRFGAPLMQDLEIKKTKYRQ